MYLNIMDNSYKGILHLQAYNPVHPKKVAVEVENTTIECTAGAIEMSPTKLDSLVAQVIDLFPEFDLQFIKVNTHHYCMLHYCVIIITVNNVDHST